MNLKRGVYVCGAVEASEARVEMNGLTVKPNTDQLDSRGKILCGQDPEGLEPEP